MIRLSGISISDNEYLCVTKPSGGELFLHSECMGMEEIYVRVSSDKDEVDAVVRMSNADVSGVFIYDIIDRRLDKITSGKYHRAYEIITKIHIHMHMSMH